MKNIFIKSFALVALMTGLNVETSFASTSEMSYEGVLTDVTGSPVTTATAMSIRITDGAACVVHTQSFPSITPDASGFFTLKLTGLTKAMFELPGSCAGTARYFELTVDGETFPLVEMDSTPYSMIAGKAQEATSLVGPMGGTTTGQILTWNQSTQTWSAQAATAGTETDPTVYAWAKNPSLASVDVPALDASKITTGTLPINRGGTGTMSFNGGQVVVANGGATALQSLNCTSGQVIKYDGSNQAVCGNDDSGGAPSGSAGGVLSGNYPSPTLSTGAITLVNFSSMGLSAGDAGKVIKWDGTSWVTAADATGISGGVANTLPKYDSANSMIPSTIQDDGAGTINIANANAKIRFNGATVLHTTGTNNTAVGNSALGVVTSGAENIAVGAHSLNANVLGVENTAIGNAAVAALTNGSYNVGVGNNALSNNLNGSNNTAIGYQAGMNTNATSNANVFVGRRAGPTSVSTISNRLYIHNNASDTPLIGGNFSTPAVDINGSLNIDFAGGYLNYQPNGNACTTGETLIWDNTNVRWNCGAAGGMGDITSVTAGTGLSGGNTSGDATLNVVYGSTSGTAAEGNDSRLSDARTPTGTAGGALTGTYPNPTLANDSVNSAKIVDGSIGAADLASNSISYAHLNAAGATANDGLVVKDSSGRLFNLQCSANQVLNWTVATGWDCINPSSLVGVTTISGGVQNYLTKFNLPGDNVVNSIVYDDGNRVGIGTSSPITTLEIFRSSITDGVWNDVGHFTAQAGGGVVVRSFVDGVTPANRKAALQATQFGYTNPGSPMPSDLILQMDGGNIGVGTTTPMNKFEAYSAPTGSTTATGRFVISSSNTVSGSSAAVVAENNRTSTAAGTNAVYGSISRANYAMTGTANGYIFGALNENILSAGTNNSAGGTYSRINNTSSSLTNAYGSLNEVTTGGTVTNAYGVKATISGGASTSAYGLATQVTGGTYGVAYGVLADVINGGGSASYGLRTSVGGSSSTAYGLYIDTISATTPFGIYQYDSTNPNYLAAPLRLGSAVAPTPTTWINIVGATNPEIKVSNVAGSIKGRIGFATSVSQISSNSLANSFIFTNDAGAVHLGSTSGVQMTVLGASVGVGTTAPGYKLDINGDTNIAAANVLRFGGTQVCASAGCTAASDERLKENIQPLPDSLNKILQLRAVEYDYKDKTRFTDKHQIGVIAQEVEQVFPEVVITDKKTGFKSVAYDHLVAPLIEAVKTIYRGLASVDARVEKLEAENASLKAYLCAKEPSAPICH